MAKKQAANPDTDLDLSDRAIARHLGVPVWVARALRERLERSGEYPQVPTGRRRTHGHDNGYRTV
jgi:hypothetical protein